MDFYSNMIFDSFRDSIRTFAVAHMLCTPYHSFRLCIDDMLHFLFTPYPYKSLYCAKYQNKWKSTFHMCDMIGRMEY